MLVSDLTVFLKIPINDLFLARAMASVLIANSCSFLMA